MPKFRKLDEEDYDRMRLPHEFRKSKLDLIPEPAKTAISNYVSDIDTWIKDGVCLVLTGNHGVGKTSAASVLVKAARASAHTAFFTTTSDLRELIRSRITFEDSPILDRCRMVDFLVLDAMSLDDGNPKDPVMSVAILEGLVKSRTMWKRPTIITTTLEEEDFIDDLEPIYFALHGSVVFLQFNGPDLNTVTEKNLRQKLLRKS